MQIYEITAPKLDEGIGGALASIAKSAGANFVKSTTGVDLKPVPSNDPNAQAAGALKINQQLAQQLGQQLNMVWGQTVQNFIASNRKDLKGAPVQAVKDASPADQDQLRLDLDKLILQATGIKEPSLDAWEAAIDTGDDKDKMLAAEIGDQIKAIEAMIWGQTLMPTDSGPSDRARAFASLGQEISRAQTLNTFTSKKPGIERVEYDKATGKFKVDGRPYVETDPKQKALVDDYMDRLAKK